MGLRMIRLKIMGSAPGGEALANVGVERRERHLAKARKQQRLRIPECPVKSDIHGLLDKAAGLIRAVANGQ